MKNSSGLQVPLCHHGVAEIMGLAGLGRGGISETTMCKCSQCSKVWADLPDPRSFASQWACLSSSCPDGFCY